MMQVYTSNYPKFSYSEVWAKSLENPDEVEGYELRSVLRTPETSAPPLVMFRDLLFIIYSTRMCSVVPFGSEAWPIKEDDVILLEGNNAMMDQSNVIPEDKISALELKNTLQLNTITK